MKEQLKAVTILLRATNYVRDILKKDIESYGLNTTEFGTLEYLYHKGPKPIQQICDRLLMANSSMTYVIDKLEKKGYVKRVADKKDRRVTYIELTKQGNAYVEEIFPKHEKCISEIFSVLNQEELQTFMTLMKKIGYHSEALIKRENN